MNVATRELVRNRARNRCEYCALHQDHSPLAPLQIEHVIPRKHGGSDHESNLALACIDCNLHKGSNIAGYDLESGVLTGLFHPPQHDWTDHFMFDGAILVGTTAIGRTTMVVLALNSGERVELRKMLGEL
jgi:HNH endonuclease